MLLTADPSLILLKCLILKYLNAQRETPDARSNQVIKELRKLIKMPRANEAEGGVAEIVGGLSVTLDFLDRVELNGYPIDSVITRVKINCMSNQSYLEIIKDALVVPEDPEAIEKSVISKRNELVADLNKLKLSTLFSDANRKINFSSDDFNLNDYVNQFQEDLEAAVTDPGQEQHEGFSGMLCSDDIESVEQVMENAQTLVSAEGVLRTGFKGFNKLLGVGGLIGGYMYCFPGLSHNYKSGLLLDLTRDIPRFNEPCLTDEEKELGLKPLIYRISFENKLEQDLPVLYKTIKEAETGEKVDILTVDAKEAAKYVMEKLTEKGWHFMMECYDANNFDIWDLIERLRRLRQEGYAIKLLIGDYIDLISRATGSLRKDQAITHNFEVLRNHCFPRGIAVATTHQLSTEAQKLAREGAADLAARVAGGGYYQNCQSLHNKLDGEYPIHLVKTGEDTYLTMAMGKLRGYSQDISGSDRVIAYKFSKVGGLIPDIMESKSRALSSIPGMSTVPTSAGGSIDDDCW